LIKAKALLRARQVSRLEDIPNVDERCFRSDEDSKGDGNFGGIQRSMAAYLVHGYGVLAFWDRYVMINENRNEFEKSHRIHFVEARCSNHVIRQINDALF
jgi:hypothetical protein